MKDALRAFADTNDECAARRVRHEMGLRGFLLSWTLDDGRWQARLTAPGVARTVSRRGETRAEAIRRAVLGAERIVLVRSGGDWPGPRKPGMDSILAKEGR